VLVKSVGASGLFLACGLVTLVWLALAWPMAAIGKPGEQAT
jgi:hypothetical protein